MQRPYLSFSGFGKNVSNTLAYNRNQNAINRIQKGQQTQNGAYGYKFNPNTGRQELRKLSPYEQLQQLNQRNDNIASDMGVSREFLNNSNTTVNTGAKLALEAGMAGAGGMALKGTVAGAKALYQGAKAARAGQQALSGANAAAAVNSAASTANTAAATADTAAKAMTAGQRALQTMKNVGIGTAKVVGTTAGYIAAQKAPQYALRYYGYATGMDPKRREALAQQGANMGNVISGATAIPFLFAGKSIPAKAFSTALSGLGIGTSFLDPQFQARYSQQEIAKNPGLLNTKNMAAPNERMAAAHQAQQNINTLQQVLAQQTDPQVRQQLEQQIQRNQIYRDESFRNPDGSPKYRTVVRSAQQDFRQYAMLPQQKQDPEVLRRMHIAALEEQRANQQANPNISPASEAFFGALDKVRPAGWLVPGAKIMNNFAQSQVRSGLQQQTRNTLSLYEQLGQETDKNKQWEIIKKLRYADPRSGAQNAALSRYFTDEMAADVANKIVGDNVDLDQLGRYSKGMQVYNQWMKDNGISADNDQFTSRMSNAMKNKYVANLQKQAETADDIYGFARKVMGLQGGGDVDEATSKRLYDKIYPRVKEEIWKDPLNNLPKAIGLWAMSKGAGKNFTDFLSSKAGFWGTTGALALGAFGLGRLLFGGRGGSNQAQQTSYQDPQFQAMLARAVQMNMERMGRERRSFA